MRKINILGFTVEYSYRDINVDLHDLDRRFIEHCLRKGFYNGHLSHAYQSPGSWCVVN